jgi:hypothetical protein
MSKKKSESKAVKRSIADGELSMQDVNRLRGKDIAFDKLLGIAAKKGATIEDKVQRGYGVDQLKNGTVNWTPSQDMGASKYFMGGRGQDPMMAALGETPGPRAGKGWVATGEHEKGGATYSFYGDPAYVQKRKDQERAKATQAAAAPSAAAQSATAQSPAAPSAAPSAPAAFDLTDYTTASSSSSSQGSGGVTAGGTGASRPAYEYKGSGSLGDTSDASATTPALFNSWMEGREGVNRASTAYQSSPGGTRHQDEAGGAAASTGSSTRWASFWNEQDGNRVQQAWSTPQADGVSDTTASRPRGRYSPSGIRYAGSIFAQPE